MTPGSRFAILEVANQPRSDPNATEPSQWMRGASPTHQPARQAESQRFASGEAARFILRLNIMVTFRFWCGPYWFLP
jgi:hypothetical protein